LTVVTAGRLVSGYPGYCLRTIICFWGELGTSWA